MADTQPNVILRGPTASGPAGFARRSRALVAATNGTQRLAGAFDVMAEALMAMGYGEGVEVLYAAVARDLRADPDARPVPDLSPGDANGEGESA